MEYYWAIKRNAVLTPATTWMNLKTCRVKEVSHRRPRTVWFRLYEMSVEIRQIHRDRTEVSSNLGWAGVRWGWGTGGSLCSWVWWEWGFLTAWGGQGPRASKTRCWWLNNPEYAKKTCNHKFKWTNYTVCSLYRNKTVKKKKRRHVPRRPKKQGVVSSGTDF